MKALKKSRGASAQTSIGTVEVTAGSKGENVDLYTSNPGLSRETEREES